MIKNLTSSLLTPLFEKTYLENFRKLQFFLQIPAWPRGSEIHCHTNSSRWFGVAKMLTVSILWPYRSLEAHSPEEGSGQLIQCPSY